MLLYIFYIRVRETVELSSKLTLEMLGKPFLLEKRIELLHAIEESGSISKAAKAVPMSYKTAWEAVDTMNALSPQPIVCRETGGKDGGGTTITAYGRQLLENYTILKEEHTRFLKRLSELTDIQSGSFKTIGRLAMQISARNQIGTEVVSVESKDVKAKIRLRFKGGQEISSIITKEAVEGLHLEQNQTVVAIFKSSAVLLNRTKDTNSDENRLHGIVNNIDNDGKSAKVTVNIGHHDTIISIVPTEVLERMQLFEGSSVSALIKANDIMIGK